MVKIHPKLISGAWKEGFTLDLHTLSSDHIGDDEYGHPQFDTKRSEMGELLYKLKYNEDKSVLGNIITTASHFIKSKNWPADLVVSVPPSRKGRGFQPVPIVAEGIATDLGIAFYANCVVKVKNTPELKDIFDFEKRLCILEDAFKISYPVVGRTVLLFDDLYRSGATLKAVTRLLMEKGKAKDVYALTLTMTRRKR